MDAADAAAYLAAVSAFDGRNPAESTARAWAAALPDVTLDDALEYLPVYYRTATRDKRNWLMPGDVLDGVTEIQKERVKAKAHLGYQAVTGKVLSEVLAGAEMYPDDHDAGMQSFRDMRAIALEDNPLAATSEQRAKQKQLEKAATPW